MEHLDTIGAPSGISCPDCNGVLWKLAASEPPRYRCHTGHAYTLRSLAHAQALRTDDALWSALRALHEREIMLREMAEARRRQDDATEAERLDVEAEHAVQHATQLQRLIARG